MHEYRKVTPLGWDQRFHHKVFVSEQAMRCIAARGGMSSWLFFQAEAGKRDVAVTGVQTCALPILSERGISVMYERALKAANPLAVLHLEAVVRIASGGNGLTSPEQPQFRIGIKAAVPHPST